MEAMTGPEQHAATVREGLRFQCDSNSVSIGEGCGECDGCKALAALDELVALAGRADELQRERDEALEAGQMMVEFTKKAERERDEARKARDLLVEGNGELLARLWKAEHERDKLRQQVCEISRNSRVLVEQARREADQLRAVVDAARVVSEVERTGVLPDFQPLADAFAALAGVQADSKHSAGLAAGDTGMGYGGSPGASAASVVAPESVTRGVPAPAANLAETALRLMAVDYAPFLNIANPETTVEEYLRRAEKGERWPFGLWRADSKDSA